MDEFIVIEQNQVILNQYIKKLFIDSIAGNFNFIGVWLGNNINKKINKIIKCNDYLKYIFFDIDKLAKNETEIFDKNCKFNLWSKIDESQIIKNPFKDDKELNDFLLENNKNDLILIFHFNKIIDDNTIPNKLKSTRSEIIKRVENLEEIIKDKEIDIKQSIEDIYENKLLNKDIEIEKLKKQILREKITNQKYQNILLKQKYDNLKLESKFLEKNLSVNENFLNTSNDSIAAESFIQLGEQLSNEEIPVAIEM